MYTGIRVWGLGFARLFANMNRFVEPSRVNVFLKLTYTSKKLENTNGFQLFFIVVYTE